MKFSFNRTMALLVISSAFFLAATSCKKSNSSSNGSTQLSATVGGNSFQPNAAAGIYSTSDGLFELAAYEIKSGDTTGMAIYFDAPLPSQMNLPISSDTAYVDVQYTDSKSGFTYDGGQIAGHSLLTVTAWDSVHLKVTGTFSGVVYNIVNGSDSLIVTNGQFSTAYTVTP
jgi:hypothetical protein